MKIGETEKIEVVEPIEDPFEKPAPAEPKPEPSTTPAEPEKVPA